ncbi:MAG: hypothetical protein RLZZ142_1305 [Verrucomicrobiota bacterium]
MRPPLPLPRLVLLLLLLAGIALTLPSPSRAEDSKKDRNALAEQLAQKLQELVSSGKSLSSDTLLAALEKPSPSPVAWIEPNQTPLRPREIAKRARLAYVRVGWIYQCTRCSRWHQALAGGYAVDPQTIATARHVLEYPKNAKPNSGLPVVLRGEDELLPIAAILASDSAHDSALVRLGCNHLQPLPLQSHIEVGDNVFCLSDPQDNRAIFTSGIVNRISRSRSEHGAPEDLFAPSANASTLTVGADWAPGSSGAALLDEAGNCVGHVATIQNIEGHRNSSAAGSDNPKSAAPVVMSLHHAIPAARVRALVPAGR